MIEVKISEILARAVEDCDDDAIRAELASVEGETVEELLAAVSELSEVAQTRFKLASILVTMRKGEEAIINGSTTEY